MGNDQPNQHNGSSQSNATEIVNGNNDRNQPEQPDSPNPNENEEEKAEISLTSISLRPGYTEIVNGDSNVNNVSHRPSVDKKDQRQATYDDDSKEEPPS